MSDYDPGAARQSELQELKIRVDRIERAVETMAWWLVAAQTGFGHRDAEGIMRILDSQQETKLRSLGEKE